MEQAGWRDRASPERAGRWASGGRVRSHRPVGLADLGFSDCIFSNDIHLGRPSPPPVPTAISWVWLHQRAGSQAQQGRSLA